MKISNEMMYDMIVDTLQFKIDNNELTIKEAEKVKELAYEKYMIENTSQNIVDNK